VSPQKQTRAEGVALNNVPDWRWLLDRPDSPWYPRTRLFRQSAQDDWEGVFTEIEKELRPLIEDEI